MISPGWMPPLGSPEAGRVPGQVFGHMRVRDVLETTIGNKKVITKTSTDSLHLGQGSAQIILYVDGKRLGTRRFQGTYTEIRIEHDKAVRAVREEW